MIYADNLNKPTDQAKTDKVLADILKISERERVDAKEQRVQKELYEALSSDMIEMVKQALRK